MNKLRNLIIAVVLLLGVASAYAQCEVPIAIAPPLEGAAIPESVSNRLEAILKRALTKLGVATNDGSSQFFITGQFDGVYNDVVGNNRYVIKTELTLYIGEYTEKRIFASHTFNLGGVGGSEAQAYTKCLNGLTAKNQELVAFVEEGKQKIIDYFDANYSKILSKARTLMSSREYGEALYITTTIPECCKGYDEAQTLAFQIFQKEIDYQGAQNLALARQAWGANPDATGADTALGYLAKIDPQSSSAAAAASLGKEISTRVQKQWDYENITKHEQAIETERQRIKAARDVATAWAKNQPKTVYKLYWVGRRYY